MIKKCIICGSEFECHRKDTQCCDKECRVERNKRYMKRYNKSNNAKEGNKKYYRDNKDKIKEYNRLYRNNINNKDKMKKYYRDNKDKVKEYNRLYNINNKGKIKEYNRNNKGKINKRMKDKYHNDVNHRIRDIIRSRINIALKNNHKSQSSEKLLGISIQKYKQYLKSQFDNDMSWDNHGSYWEIDHIRPLSTFNLSDEEQQRIAFNYKNTRPLEKSINRCRPKDGSDITGEQLCV